MERGIGVTAATQEEFQCDGAWKLLNQFLLARRLVEAGARCVTLAFSRWDWHDNNFGRARLGVSLLDQDISTLVQDLHHRGLDKDVSVVVCGELGTHRRSTSAAAGVTGRRFLVPSWPVEG